MRQTVFALLYLLPLVLGAQNDTIMGDLNGDGINEMVVVYPFEPSEKAEEDTLARAVIYRWAGQQFTPWAAAAGPLLFAWDEIGYERLAVEIDRGVLVVHHFHSGWSSSLSVHRFRWQNNRFELIGATVNYSERCENVRELDYNLSTGRYFYEEFTMMCTEDQPETQEPFSFKGWKLPDTPYLLTEFSLGDGQVLVKNRGFISF